jgi:hypothetical protein
MIHRSLFRCARAIARSLHAPVVRAVRARHMAVRRAAYRERTVLSHSIRQFQRVSHRERWVAAGVAPVAVDIVGPS